MSYTGPLKDILFVIDRGTRAPSGEKCPMVEKTAIAMKLVTTLCALVVVTMAIWYCADAIERSSNSSMFSTFSAVKGLVER